MSQPKKEGGKGGRGERERGREKEDRKGGRGEEREEEKEDRKVWPITGVLSPEDYQIHRTQEGSSLLLWT